MQFVHPLFLLALITLTIPVIIHLFNFRKFKKVYFTNVQFLQQIQQETKKQSQLKQLLILLARLLVIASLVIAFAQPFIPYSKSKVNVKGQHCVSIYIDNSFSMEAVATRGKLIDIAKTKALEIVQAYNASDLFQILTNDFEGRHQRFVNRDEFRKMVNEIKLSPVPRTLPEVVIRQNDMLSENTGKHRDAYLISDFQKSTMFFQNIKPDSSVSWFFVPLHPEKRNNLYIDSVWFLSPVHQPGQPVQLKVRIGNDANEPLEKIPVKLSINSIQKAIGSVAVGPNAATEIVLPFTENPEGIQYGMVEINDYPVVNDDHYYFSYTVLPSVPVLCIIENHEDKYLNALFGNDSAFRFTNCPIRQLDYSSLSDNALIILNNIPDVASGLAQEVIGFIRNGGTLIIFPPEKGNMESYKPFFDVLNTQGYMQIDTLRQRVSSINLENELFSDIFEKRGNEKTALPENVDLPSVTRHYVIPSSSRSKLENLMSLQNKDPFLTLAPLGKGRVYLFTVPLQEGWSNFPRHVIFLPTLYKIALSSKRIQPLSYIAGENNLIELPLNQENEKNIIKIKKNNSDFEMIPGTSKQAAGLLLYTQGQITEDGLYTITNGQKSLAGLGFNYSRKESAMKYYTDSELNDLTRKISSGDIRILTAKKNSLTQQIQQIRQGTPIWKLFLLLALLFLAIEIALLNLIK